MLKDFFLKSEEEKTVTINKHCYCWSSWCNGVFLRRISTSL